MPATEEDDKLHPKKAIRRFDVFAEYSRLERLDKGDPEDKAKGYGIWLAKVVASRKFGQKSDSSGDATSSHTYRPEHEDTFRSVGNEVQTDETFDQDIVDRMGATFYTKLFAPAIEDAMKSGKSYEEIRDTIRKDWKPAKSTRRKST